MSDSAGDPHETAAPGGEATGAQPARPTILDAVEVGGTWTVVGDADRRPSVRRRRRRRGWPPLRGAAAAAAVLALIVGVAAGYWLVSPNSPGWFPDATDGTRGPAPAPGGLASPIPTTETGPATQPSAPDATPSAAPSGPSPAPSPSEAAPTPPPAPTSTIQPTVIPSAAPTPTPG
jgi:hypothetical protein